MTYIYDELVAAGCRTASHESDLYVKVDDVSRPLVRQAIVDKRLGVNRPILFVSTHPEDKGALWYELPFAYAPFWRSRGLKG